MLHTFKGWLKPDDPIFKMGLVVSARTIKPSSKDAAPKPEAKPAVKPSPDPQMQAQPASPRPRPRSTRKRKSTSPGESASAAGKRTPAPYRKLTNDKPDPTAKPTGRVFWTEADDSLYNEPATMSFKYWRVPPPEAKPIAAPKSKARRSRKTAADAGEITKEQAIEIATRERCAKRESEPRSKSSFVPYVHMLDVTELPEECMTAIKASDEPPIGLYHYWDSEPAWYVWFLPNVSGLASSHVIVVSKRTGKVIGRGSAGDEG
jgi:hypothetical protein